MKSSTKQQTHRQCLTMRGQTSSSCSTHILQHTLSMSEGTSLMKDIVILYNIVCASTIQNMNLVLTYEIL